MGLNPTRAALLACPLLAACSDFSIAKDPPGGDPVDDTDPAVPVVETDPPESDPPDTDTGEPPQDDQVATSSMYAHSNIALFSVDPVAKSVTRIGGFRGPGGQAVAMADIAIDLSGYLYAGGFEANANGTHTIWRVDPTTAAVTRVCDVGIVLTGMTFLSDGRLVVGAEHALTVVDLGRNCLTSELYRDNGLTTSGDVVGLPDGKLYWTVTGAGNDVLMRVDPVAGTASRVGVTGQAQLYGMAYDEPTGLLYGFSSSNRQIVTINPANAASTPFPVVDRQYWWGATTNPVVW